MGMKTFHKTAFDEIINELMKELLPEFSKSSIAYYNRRTSHEDFTILSEFWVENFLTKLKTKANAWAKDKINQFKFHLNDDTKEELIGELTNRLYFDIKCKIWRIFFDEGFWDN